MGWLSVGAGMRRIVMFNRVSADGFFCDAKGGLDWVVPDAKLDKAVMSGDVEIGTILFGRRTYEMFAAFWPHVTEDTPAPHGDGPMSREQLAMAAFLNESDKVVFSKTLGKPTWRNTRVVPRFDPREVAAMKRGRGKDIIVFGSGSIVSQLTEHRLIDEYQLVVSPVMLGSGKPLTGGFAGPVGLELEEARKFPTGNVLLRYGLADAGAAGS